MMRTNMFRRILALLLLAAMASSLLGVSALAAPMYLEDFETQKTQIVQTTPIYLPAPDCDKLVIEAKLKDTADWDIMDALAYKLIEVRTAEAGTMVDDETKVERTAYQPDDPEYLWAEGLRAWIGANYPQFIDQDNNSVTPDFAKLTETEAIDFFGKLEAAIENDAAVDKSKITAVSGGKGKISADVTARFENLTMGEYLIVIKEANSVYKSTVVPVVPFLNESKVWCTNGKTVISMKGTPVSLDKSIANVRFEQVKVPKGEEPKTEMVVDSYCKETSASYGDTIYYRIVSLIPSYLDQMESWEYQISDAMTKLTLNPESIKIVLDDETDITEKVKEKDRLTTSDIKFTVNLGGKEIYKEILAGHEKVTVTYQATLDLDAVLAGENPNTATLTYSNNPYVKDQSTPLQDKNKVFTYGVEITKFKKLSGKEEPLEGVQFILLNEKGDEVLVVLRDDGVYSVDPEGEDVLTSDEKGMLTIVGLGEGTYTLRETLIPDKQLNQNPPAVKFTLKDKVDLAGNRTGAIDGDIGERPEELPKPQEPEADETGEVKPADKKKYDADLAAYEKRKAEIAEWDKKHAKELSGIYQLTVINTPPPAAQTGGLGTIPFTLLGIMLMAGGCALIVTAVRRRETQA